MDCKLPIDEEMKMTDKIEVAEATESVTAEAASPAVDVAATVTESDSVDETESHPALSLLDKIEAKLFFVETQVATEIKQVIDEIKSHF